MTIGHPRRIVSLMNAATCSTLSLLPLTIPGAGILALTEARILCGGTPRYCPRIGGIPGTKFPECSRG